VHRIVGELAWPPWAEIRTFGPEVVVHAAWITTPGAYLESVENDEWLRWSLAFAAGLAGAGLRRWVALGTCIEYAVTGAPAMEDATPLVPTSRYARTKVALHEGLRAILGGTGVGLAWARIFYPYGPGEHPARLASWLAGRIRAGEPFGLRTPASTKDYIHKDDVGSALLTLACAGEEGAFNVGTGMGVTVEELARTLAGLAGRPELVVVEPGVVVDPLDHVVADVGRLRGLGWRPQVSLVDGLRGLLESRRE
jgi:nucleoside-diphosphate-sugar epimerase